MVIIPVGGLVILGVCYLLYAVVYNLVESLFFSNDPTSVPAGIIRQSYAVTLVVLYLVLLRTKVSDLPKATILTGPLATLIIAAILAFYQKQALAIVAIVVIAAFCLFLMYRYKKPWIYYYATAASVLVAIAYAWPEA